MHFMRRILKREHEQRAFALSSTKWKRLDYGFHAPFEYFECTKLHTILLILLTATMEVVHLSPVKLLIHKKIASRIPCYLTLNL